MKFVTKIPLIIAGVCLLQLIFITIPDEHRALFGEEQGNTVLFVEIGFVLGLYIGFRIYNNKKPWKAAAFCLIVAALFCAYLGWFVQPHQVWIRANDRVYDIEDLEFNADISEETLMRRQIELRARKLELSVIELKYINNASLYGSSFDSWIFWILSASLFCSGMVIGYRNIDE